MRSRIFVDRQRRLHAAVWATLGALAAFTVGTLVFATVPSGGVPQAAVSTAVRLILIPVGSAIGWIVGYRR